MIVEIVVVGVKQYFEIIDGVKTYISSENCEISSLKNDPALVLAKYELIEEINKNTIIN